MVEVVVVGAVEEIIEGVVWGAVKVIVEVGGGVNGGAVEVVE